VAPRRQYAILVKLAVDSPQVWHNPPGTPAKLAPDVDAAAVADALLAEGICAEVTPELASGYADLLTPEDR
jgi:hypothetical protein